MTFERSAEGQKNRALFLHVDYVIYVEGVEDSASGDDVLFWSTVFSAKRPDLRIRCIGKGGKPILQRLANDVMENNIGNTLVAMDADYCRLRKSRIIEDHRVLYTYGYSWENDLYSQSFVPQIYAHVAKRVELNSEETSHLSETWKKLAIEAHWPMTADFLALCATSSIIPRDSPGRLIGKNNSGKPFVKRDQCIALCAAVNSSSSRKCIEAYNERPKDVERYFVGKALALAVRYQINSCLKAFSNRSISSAEHLQDVALLIFRHFLFDNKKCKVSDYYAELLKEV